jgi:hypothetical protein
VLGSARRLSPLHCCTRSRRMPVHEDATQLKTKEQAAQSTQKRRETLCHDIVDQAARCDTIVVFGLSCKQVPAGGQAGTANHRTQHPATCWCNHSRVKRSCVPQAEASSALVAFPSLLRPLKKPSRSPTPIKLAVMAPVRCPSTCTWHSMHETVLALVHFQSRLDPSVEFLVSAI